MAYSDEELNDIFDKTNGECHLCSGRLTFSAHGDLDHPRGWEVDHSTPRANGGTDLFRNLWPAHVSCNRQKGAMSNASFRRMYLEEEDAEEFDWLTALAVGGIAVAIFLALNQPTAPAPQENRIYG